MAERQCRDRHERRRRTGSPGEGHRGVAERRVQLLQLGPQVLPRGLPGDAGHARRAPHPDGVPRERRRDGQGAARNRGRGRGLRALHPVRRLRAALPEHALHGRLLPLPPADGRRRQGDAGARRRSGIHQPGWQRWNASRTSGATSRCSTGHPSRRSTSPTGRQGLDLPIGGETVLFCDCEAAFYRTSLPRAVAQDPQGAGVEFGLMREQWCCGGPAAEMGYADQARRFAEHNVADWRAVGAKRILVLDPHDYITFTEDYPSYFGDDYDFEIVLVVELVAELIREREARAHRADRATVTYHDACRLNKRKGIHEEPREILRAIPGLTFKDVDHVTQWSYCSGGGAGLPIERPDLTAAISRRRVERRPARGRHARVGLRLVGAAAGEQPGEAKRDRGRRSDGARRAGGGTGGVTMAAIATLPDASSTSSSTSAARTTSSPAGPRVQPRAGAGSVPRAPLGRLHPAGRRPADERRTDLRGRQARKPRAASRSSRGRAAPG